LETPDDVTKVQEHNEREKDRYSNVDIVPERTALNVHFKSPTDDYVKMFEQMEQDKIISTRGLRNGTFSKCNNPLLHFHPCWLQSAVGSPRALPRGNAVTAVTSADQGKMSAPFTLVSPSA
jgi:hypothetical protein